MPLVSYSCNVKFKCEEVAGSSKCSININYESLLQWISLYTSLIECVAYKVPKRISNKKKSGFSCSADKNWDGAKNSS